MEKGILSGVAPKSYVGVQLLPEAYDDNGKYKVEIRCECTEKIRKNEDLNELISDTVSDYCRQNILQPLAEELNKIGINDEDVDWWPVTFLKV